METSCRGSLNTRNAGHKVKSIQETLGVGKTQIYETLKNKVLILARYERGSLPAHRKLLVAQRTRFSTVNDRVLEWFHCCRAKNFPLTGSLIREKASSIAKSMGIDDFEASGGWLQKFVARHQLTNSILCGEGGEVKIETVSEWKGKLSGLIEGYSANNIFNCDETGLFFRTLPSRSYVSKCESAKNGKLAKDRITVLLASSMAGEKLRPLVIGKSANPRCFTKDYKQQMRVTYEANRKAWMTSEIFLKWLHQLNNKMVIQNRKILLFMDNCGAHVPATLSNMKIIFFPPNTTSHLQPMDAGVIQNVKLQYRKSMLKSILLNMDEYYTATEITELLEQTTNVIESEEEDDLPGSTPDNKPPSSKEAMRMATKILRYAQESPDIGDERDSYLQLARTLYDTQANILINQRMHATKQSKIDKFFPKVAKT
uniref:HTH CENPB-type domain-containing protein n=1 Tax=Hippocampus comes TaxID=109280 RepID=A0A3Q3DRB9_HIPCM